MYRNSVALVTRLGKLKAIIPGLLFITAAQAQYWVKPYPYAPTSDTLPRICQSGNLPDQSRDSLTNCTHPARRIGAVMAYDDSRRNAVLFGGWGFQAILDTSTQSTTVSAYMRDTWTWDGISWRLHSAGDGPSARTESMMVYDSVRNETVLFGGRYGGDAEVRLILDGPLAPNQLFGDLDGMLGGAVAANRLTIPSLPLTPLGDTWVFNGQWSRKTPASSPSPRYGQAMAFDAVREQVVLFGVPPQAGAQPETWVWDGNNWTQKFPAKSPTVRTGAAMTFDPVNGNVVLFGGLGLADTWTWDGQNWTQRSPATAPPGRSFHNMVYDQLHNEVLLFGGQKDSTLWNDLWSWNGVIWKQKTTSNSTYARSKAAMAYDSDAKELLAFSGQSRMGTSISNFLETDDQDMLVLRPALQSTGRNPQTVQTNGGLVEFSVMVRNNAGGLGSAPVTFQGPSKFITLSSMPVTPIQGVARITGHATELAGSYQVTASLPSGESLSFSISNMSKLNATGACVVTTPKDDDSPGSLRYQAAACGKGGTITFAPGLSRVFLFRGYDIQLGVQSPNVTLTGAKLTIDGAGAVTVDAMKRSRAFFVYGTVNLKNLKIENGYACGGRGADAAMHAGGGGSGMGGAIFLQDGVLDLSSVTFSGNTAMGGMRGRLLPWDWQLRSPGEISEGGGGGFGGQGFAAHVAVGGAPGDLLGASAGDGAGGGNSSRAGFGGGSNHDDPGFGGGGGFGSMVLGFAGIGTQKETADGAGLGGAVFVRAGQLKMSTASFLNNSAMSSMSAGSSSSQSKGGALFVYTGATAVFSGVAPVFSGNVAIGRSSRDFSVSCSDVLGAGAIDSDDLCGALNPTPVR